MSQSMSGTSTIHRRSPVARTLLMASLVALAGCASLNSPRASSPPAFVDREIDGYLVHLGTDESVNKACLAQSPLLAPALKGIGVRFLGCALLATDEAYSIDEPGVIAHELCHLRLHTDSHVLCPPPDRREKHSASLPDASPGPGAAGAGATP